MGAFVNRGLSHRGSVGQTVFRRLGMMGLALGALLGSFLAYQPQAASQEGAVKFRPRPVEVIVVETPPMRGEALSQEHKVLRRGVGCPRR